MNPLPRFLASEVGLTELTGNELRARVARARMFLLKMTPRSETSPDLAKEHLAYLHGLELNGSLFAWGLVEPGNGAAGYELAVIVAPSQEDAEQIAADEPLHQAGLALNAVQGHTINEGVACYIARAMSKRAEALAGTSSLREAKSDLTHEQLLSRMQHATLQLVWLTPADKPRPPEDKQTGYDHFIWLRGNEMDARLMTCGPVEALQPLPSGIWGGGLGVFAASRDEAEYLASVEPSGQAGYRTLSVETWTVEYGLAAPIAKSLETLNQLPRPA